MNEQNQRDSIMSMARGAFEERVLPCLWRSAQPAR